MRSNFVKWFTPIQSGFTLIELLVSMAVLSVLASVVITIIDPVGQFQKARDAARKTDLTQLQKALEQYYQDNGTYPDQVNYLIHGVSGGPGGIAWGQPWTPYMNILPQDPDSAKRTYVYFASADEQSYWIYASLERSSDPQLCTPGSLTTPCPSMGSGGNNIPATSCQANGSGAVCNYGVSSPNVSL